MKKLIILLIAVSLIGCTKETLKQEEVKPVDISKTIKPNTDRQ